MTLIERRLGAIERQLADHHRHLLGISTMLEDVMSAISDFAAKVKAFNDRQDTAVNNLQADVKALGDKITELQNSAGQVTPEDQKLLDDIEARQGAITDKLDALDSLTPPTPPPA